MIMRKLDVYMTLCQFTYMPRPRMTTLEHASHVARRKGYAPHYTPFNLALFQPEIHDLTLGLLHVSILFLCFSASSKLLRSY